MQSRNILPLLAILVTAKAQAESPLTGEVTEKLVGASRARQIKYVDAVPSLGLEKISVRDDLVLPEESIPDVPKTNKSRVLELNVQRGYFETVDFNSETFSVKGIPLIDQFSVIQGRDPKSGNRVADFVYGPSVTVEQLTLGGGAYNFGAGWKAIGVYTVKIGGITFSFEAGKDLADLYIDGRGPVDTKFGGAKSGLEQIAYRMAGRKVVEEFSRCLGAENPKDVAEAAEELSKLHYLVQSGVQRSVILGLPSAVAKAAKIGEPTPRKVFRYLLAGATAGLSERFYRPEQPRKTP